MTDTVGAAARAPRAPGDRAAPLLQIRDVSVTFSTGRGRNKSELHALDHVDLDVGAGEIIGIVGESGSGKSTLARVICGLQPHAGGSMRFDGEDLGLKRDRAQRKAIQMVFQDPYASLDPRMTMRQTLAELLRFHRIVPRAEVDARCRELADLVQLPQNLLDSAPSEMSGGQRQRVAIARALSLEPRVLVADEAVSALDVSVQAGVVNLLADLRETLDLSILFIAHDLAVVRSVCDRVSVVYLGRIVEEAPAAALFADARHPYTQGLLASIPRLDGVRAAAPVAGEASPDMTATAGCPFQPRCPLAIDICATERPLLLPAESDLHTAACHLVPGHLPPKEVPI